MRDEKCIYDSCLNEDNSGNVTAASTLQNILFGEETNEERKLISHAKSRLKELDKILK